jgi:hypothetical protein
VRGLLCSSSLGCLRILGLRVGTVFQVVAVYARLAPLQQIFDRHENLAEVQRLVRGAADRQVHVVLQHEHFLLSMLQLLLEARDLVVRIEDRVLLHFRDVGKIIAFALVFSVVLVLPPGKVLVRIFQRFVPVCWCAQTPSSRDSRLQSRVSPTASRKKESAASTSERPHSPIEKIGYFGIIFRHVFLYCFQISFERREVTNNGLSPRCVDKRT